MLIDIHTHARSHQFPRSDGSILPTPEELIAMLDSQGIDKAVLLSYMNPECSDGYVTPEEVLHVAALYPDRFIPFCSLDPRMFDNTSNTDFRPLLQYYKDAGCKGIGEYVPNLPFDDPYQMNVFGQVAEIGLPLTFHIGVSIGGCYGCYDEVGLPRLEKVLKTFPDLVLFGHSQAFWAEISADVSSEDRRAYPHGKVTPGRVVELMKEYPNLYGDLSAGSGFNAIARDPEFGYGFMEEFQDRLFFGTDICNMPQHNPIVPFFQELKRKSLISKDAYDKIVWKNANRVLGLMLDIE